MLIFPDQKNNADNTTHTKALDLFALITSLACPTMHFSRMLTFSLSDLAALHRGRKSPMSFCTRDYQSGSEMKDTSLDLSYQNETDIYFVTEEERWRIKRDDEVLS